MVRPRVSAGFLCLWVGTVVTSTAVCFAQSSADSGQKAQCLSQEKLPGVKVRWMRPAGNTSGACGVFAYLNDLLVAEQAGRAGGIDEEARRKIGHLPGKGAIGFGWVEVYGRAHGCKEKTPGGPVALVPYAFLDTGELRLYPWEKECIK